MFLLKVIIPYVSLILAAACCFHAIQSLCGIDTRWRHSSTHVPSFNSCISESLLCLPVLLGKPLHCQNKEVMDYFT